MKIFFCLSLSLAAAAATAQPKLIGHRGSYWGVENSVESFTAGAEKGYQYLETDVKVAGDGTFVLTHDDSTERLGGSLDITQSTIEQLKAETYTQTRGGVTYTGKICTLDEYLQICKDRNVIPFVELKWATGINNNDCSNLSRMVDKIIEYGFGRTAIINTSMKKCLEYVRKNYPDFKLMFLCNTNWETNFDWCVEQGIGAYIQTGCFDRNTVVRFHEKGLKVGVWTVNTNAAYTTYGNYGCDLIAVDYLDPAELPELDPFSALTPNKTDYPDHRGIVQDSYSFERTYAGTAGQSAVKKAAAIGSRVFTLHADGTVSRADMTARSQTGIPVAPIGTISDIAATADGFLALCAVSSDGKTKIHLWSEASGTKELVELEGCGENAAFCFSGTAEDWKIYHTASGGIRAVTSGGQTATNTISLGSQATLTVSPFSRDNLIVDSPSALPAEYTFDWENDGASMRPFMSAAAESGISPLQTSLTPFRYGAKVYAAAYTGNGFRLMDMTGGLAGMSAVCAEFADEVADESGFIGGFAEVEKGDIRIYAVAGSSIVCYTAKGEEPEGNIGETDFRIEKLWSFTDNEGNAPGHIDGTNAQQGAAHKGVFYINDCADKLIYVYTENGLAGTLPGGGGWGAAVDDAGNVIVRDDKSASASHRLLVYPAGAMPGNGTEPTAIDLELPDAGQTNFISASGDVLGEGGYVYFFPNKQTVANLAKIAGGQFVEAIRSQTLAIESSTAGYIVPIRNNPERWLYMVRNQGIYSYNGADEGLLLGGSSTRPPVRNSTCGAEFFTLSSHDILVFNSGANYTGGFTLKDVTDNKIIETISPIGTKGYTEGGNYSVSNWINAEKIDPGSYYLYQYCPANGIAAYRFYDANYKPEGSVATVTETGRLRVFPNPATGSVTIEGGGAKAEIYSAGGTLVATVSLSGATTADISRLAPGLYIVRAAGMAAKLVKR